MVSNILRKLQKLAVLSVISVGAVGSATAGLFCNMQCCQQPRAYFSPACEPAWGYHQTCWRKFPELEPCSGRGRLLPIMHDGRRSDQRLPTAGHAVCSGDAI